MDAADVFRQGLGSIHKARQARAPRERESSHDSDRGSQIAHTLAACCRCRQRKTRCDPNLPRCIPCERAGAICEYYDTSKGRKMRREYVVDLQEKVRRLEIELKQYTEDELPREDTEDSIRPGGLVRLSENDETPRFLGPSSGIAMTRLVMEEAKRYTDSRTIRELVPEVVERRTPVSSPGTSDHASPRKRSFPMISAVAAEELPSRVVTDKLVEVFNQKAQYMFPTIHETTFAKELEEVYAGDKDPYKNYVLRMVLAISMQKLDAQYAGLADSYYLAAMQYVEDVIRPKDLKTLQCLVLIAQYSTMTPTRTAVYYILGLAVRICQQLGLTEEKTISQGVALGADPLQMDMRRRLSWCVLNMEFGLSHSLGRPNGFAIGQDHFDVQFFRTVDDQYITAEGILPAPISEKKVMSIHFFKMRLLQAEIRRVLYQIKRPEPNDDEHPWFDQMQGKLRAWLDACPPTPSWSKVWFTNRYNTMVVFLYRPSPQVPKPSVRAASLCYNASAFNINMLKAQLNSPLIDMTWISLQALFMAVNTVLWTVSYSDIRALHPKDEIQDLLRIALAVIRRCVERWPGSLAAADLYNKLSEACLRSYDHARPHTASSIAGTSPASANDIATPSSDTYSDYSAVTSTSKQNGPSPLERHSSFEPPPTFGAVFDQGPSQISPQEYHPLSEKPLPAFRSGSIFVSPNRTQTDRRHSYFPPDCTAQAYQAAAPPLSKHQNPQHGGNWPVVHVQQVSNIDQQSISVTGQIQPQSLNFMSDHINHNILEPNSGQPLLNTTQYVDPAYFVPLTFNFGPHLYDQNSTDVMGRQDSLSQQQQRELMAQLETNGLSGIDSYLGLNMQQPYKSAAGG